MIKGNKTKGRANNNDEKIKFIYIKNKLISNPETIGKTKLSSINKSSKNSTKVMTRHIKQI